MNSGRPITSLAGTNPQKRPSLLSGELSPSAKNTFGGTVSFSPAESKP